MNTEETLNKPHPLSSTVAVVIFSLISCGLWGSAPIFIKLGYEHFQIDTSNAMNIMLFAGMRFALAGLMVIVCYSIICKKPIVPRRQAWKAVFYLSLAQTTVQYFFYYIGVANSSGTKASILSGSSSMISVLFACLIFHQEKMTWGKALGCLCGIAGTVLVNLQGSTEAMTFDMSLMGEGFVLLSSISGAVSAVFIRKFSQAESPVTLCGWQFFTGGLTLMAIALAGGGELGVVTGKAVAILVYLGMVSAVAYTLRSILLKYNTVSRVSVYSFLIPIVGVILAATLLGEHGVFTMMTFAAMVLICGSIWIVNREQNK